MKNVFVEGTPILNQGTVYAFQIAQERTHEVRIVVEDAEREMKTEIPLQFVVKKPDMVGSIIVTPSEGFEPLVVRLDASQTVLNIPGDEIIYFSWDFGDGEVRKNLTNGVFSHTYTYDHEKENGTFMPKVTITTRQGHTTEVSPALPILVKKQLVQVSLSSPSHPTQIARVGDAVRFQAEFNGLPDMMKWNFGDGKDIVQCRGRSCAEVSKVFDKPGTYSVKLTLEFEDNQPVDSLMDIRVN